MLMAGLAASACSQESDEVSTGGAGAPPGPSCAPGETPLADGGCRPPGVPADGCAPGFVFSEPGGCDPILPAGACPMGQMAVPGETACREVAPCGDAPWGDIPVEATTEHVDGSYVGGQNDGSAARPWTTVQQGVDAAAAGAVVAIAAGSYAEDVYIQKSVRLWGRCPALVEITSTGGMYSAISVYTAASNQAEVHGLAVRGARWGIEVSAAEGPVLDRVWVHDTGIWGVVALSDLGPASFTLSRSLVERATEIGVYPQGVDATIAETVVRDTLPNAQQQFGRGIAVRDYAITGARSTATIRASVIEGNRYSGLHVSGSDVTVDGSVIRDQLEQPFDSAGGRGINAQLDLQSGQPPALQISGSVLERNRDAAIFADGTQLTIERTVVRDTSASAENVLAQGGRGVNVQVEPTTGTRVSLVLRSSLIATSNDVGVYIFASDATLEGVLVRDTSPLASDGSGGRALDVQDSSFSMEPSHATIKYSTFERSFDIGVFVAGSELELDASVIRDTTGRQDTGSAGYGLAVRESELFDLRSRATVRGSAVERSVSAGILLFRSDATIESSQVIAVASDRNGTFGDGIFADELSVATIQGARFEACARAGVAAFGADISLASSVIECAALPLNGEQAGQSSYSFLDQGGNVCGCGGQTEICQVLSSALAVPETPYGDAQQ